MSKLLTWLPAITSRPKSSNKSQIIWRDCPIVGLTYKTAEPGGQRSASMMSVVAANLDLPQRRPAATTLNRVLSSNTVCCHGSSWKLRSDIAEGVFVHKFWFGWWGGLLLHLHYVAVHYLMQP